MYLFASIQSQNGQTDILNLFFCDIKQPKPMRIVGEWNLEWRGKKNGLNYLISNNKMERKISYLPNMISN